MALHERTSSEAWTYHDEVKLFVVKVLANVGHNKELAEHAHGGRELHTYEHITSVC